jgi:glycerol-3-phosphate acyltransferase PlsY
MSIFYEIFSERWTELLQIIVLCYLIGSLNFSIIIARLKKAGDIRTMGSGNAGFTNVLRSMGVGSAIATFAGDFLKGVFAVFLAKIIVGNHASSENNFFILMFFEHLAGAACVLGHLYPCYFGGRGGKGILAMWAVTLLIDYRIFFATILVFLAVLFLTKIVSLASVSAAIFYPISVFFVTLFVPAAGGHRIAYISVCTAMSLICSATIVYRHKSNIQRIMAGTEKKITNKIV